MDKDETDPLLASMAGALAAHGYLVRAPDKSVVPATKPEHKRVASTTVSYSAPAQRFRDHPNPEHVVFEMVREGFNQNLDNHQINDLIRGGFLVLEPKMIAGDKLQLSMRLLLQEQEPGPLATEVKVAPPARTPAPATTLMALHVYGEEVRLPVGASFPPVSGQDMVALKDAIRAAVKRTNHPPLSDPRIDGLILKMMDEHYAARRWEYEEQNRLQARFTNPYEPFKSAAKLLGKSAL